MNPIEELLQAGFDDYKVEHGVNPMHVRMSRNTFQELTNHQKVVNLEEVQRRWGGALFSIENGLPDGRVYIL